MTQNDPVLTPNELLLDEAKKFYNLAKDYRRDRYMKDEKSAYIIDRKFLSRWKIYVNYKEIKKKLQYSYYSNEKNNFKIPNGPHPGTINNQSLLLPLDSFYNDGDPENIENYVIRPEFDQRTHYRIVNKEIWDFFLSRYGGEPVIIKSQIEEKSKYGYSKKIIEVVYKKYDLIVLPSRQKINELFINNLTAKSIFLSRIKTLKQLKEKIVKNINFVDPSYPLDISKIRLWKINCELKDLKFFLHQNNKKIQNSKEQIYSNEIVFLEYEENSSLEDLDYFDTDKCLVELFDEDWIIELRKTETRNGSCEWCKNSRILRFYCLCKEVWYCSDSCKDRDVRFHEDKCKKKLEIEESGLKKTDESKNGLVGLSNLGNTCFMNTALQCISNCWELANYFLEGHYKNQINNDNPIGSQGVLARTYAHLVSNLWYGTSQVFTPSKFKRAIGTFQSIFNGYQQHDTQEFLNYLLDGLHEDLNKVLKKPLVEKIETDEPDDIKSRRSWMGYLRRNQSILVDLLYGQYKSTLYCPDETCNNVSVTFDPFLSVSLPLANSKTSQPFYIRAFFLFYDTRKTPIKVQLNFNSDTTIMGFRNKVAKMMNIHPFSFLVAKIENNSQYEAILSSSTPINFRNAPEKLFIIQINPDVFYSANNCLIHDFSERPTNEAIIQSVKKYNEDYNENDNGQTQEKLTYYSKVQNEFSRNTQIMINNDDNNGLPRFLNVCIFLKRYESSDIKKRVRIIFPRLISMSRDWTLKEVHYQIFSFIYPILRKYEKVEINHHENNSMIEMFNQYFKDYDSLQQNDSHEFQKSKGWPYRIRIKNQNINTNLNCFYCNKKCDDCLLPFTNDLRIEDLLDNVPKIDGKKLDNSYLYIKEKDRNDLISNRDLNFELTFLEDYTKAVGSLNDYDDMSKDCQIKPQTKSMSIYDCFKNFVKEETLRDDNMWYCSKCKNHKKARKKLEIYNAPHILIIHLKRFSAHSKIDTLVDFPVKDLDLNDFVKNKTNESMIYDLFAISNHFGGLGGGHYVAYAKNHDTQRWHEFNDSSVSEINEKEIVSPSAYVLFYRRKNSNINLQELYVKQFEDYEKCEAIECDKN